MSALGNHGRLEQFKAELDGDFDTDASEKVGPARATPGGALITIAISKAAGCV
ncbi:hypothetical protein [Halobaculum sp. MBLA0143]|uniref:hypothetical protein n=1 Tax=Halobaculum sp. MBLA0143 TaxID=3079933 RepID=UPI0035249DB4